MTRHVVDRRGRISRGERGANEARVTSRWRKDDGIKIDLHQIFQTENLEYSKQLVKDSLFLSSNEEDTIKNKCPLGS